jgi:hypothetical protein
MTIARLRGRALSRRLRAVPGVGGCLLLIACAASDASNDWVKTGADSAATLRELQDCQQRASVVEARQQGINQDITATLGGNWRRSNTLGVVTQTMNNQAASAGAQTLDACMQGKGFVKRS